VCECSPPDSQFQLSDRTAFKVNHFQFQRGEGEFSAGEVSFEVEIGKKRMGIFQIRAVFGKRRFQKILEECLLLNCFGK